MITPFRIIKNKYLRENKHLKNTDAYWIHTFYYFCDFLEQKFLAKYNIINNNIKANRQLEISKFADELLSINDIFIYMQNNFNIKQDYHYIHINNEISVPTFQAYLVFSSFDNIIKTLNKKKIILCFNLTPIREPIL